jgi:hypothetical protein
MAFILAGLVALASFVVWFFALFAAGMSDSPSASNDAAHTAHMILFVGLLIAALISASHWIHFPSW